MKSTVNVEGPKPFPKLMRHTTNDHVVLFTDKTTGTVLHGGQYAKIGQHSKEWLPCHFEDIHGPVTITFESE